MNSHNCASAAGLLRFPCLLLTLTAGIPAARADLVALWDMNSPGINGVQPDIRAGLPARLLGGAVLSADGEGRSGAAGDRAARFGTANQRLHLVENSGYFTTAAAGNVLSVSFWIKQAGVRNATALSFVAPSTAGGRGFQAHAPWSDNNIYFDTGGCCDGTMRTNAVSADFTLVGFSFPYDYTPWRQMTLVKDGDNKFIYLDGVLLKTGVNTAPIAVAITNLFIGNAPNTTEAVNGDIDDFAVYSHALSATDAVALATGVSPVQLAGVTPTDSDGDLLPDQWELRFFPGDLTQLTGPGQDQDNDGLLNSVEFDTGTNPGHADTDGDGAPDGVETNTGVWVSASDRGTSPFNPDTDGDGLLDGAETNTGTYVSAANTGSNPHLTDTDNDLTNDGLEVRYGSNPVNAASTPIQAGVPTLLAWWRFNDNSNPAVAVESRVGHTGNITGLAAYSPDGEGFTGAPGDMALRITGAGGKLRLDNASPWINLATRLDKFTVSFWQRNEAPTPPSGQSSFWFYSTAAGAASSFRGFQAHCPWSGNTVYFDSAGCCATGSQRSNAAIVQDWSQWRHYVFLKNGTTKRMYVDGVEQPGLSSTTAAPLQTDFSAINIGSDNASGSMLGWLDEFAIFASPLSTQDITDLATRAKTPAEVATSSDSDTDGLADSWEYTYFPGDLTKLNAVPADFDADGSSDFNEQNKQTDPTDSDTDNDGLPDGPETGTGVWVSATDRGTSPLNADTDGDTLPDVVETNTLTYVSASDTGTNPVKADSDNDTFRDDVEILYNSDPSDDDSRPFNPGQTFLLALWPFDDDTNPAAANDTVISLPGVTTGAYTLDAEGHSGAPTDKAMRFLPDQAVTASAAFMNLAAPGDSISIVFWQKLATVRSSSTFWATSPNPANAGRGLQAHVPWGNFNLYFDHAGCCDPGVHRLEGPYPPIDPLQWHHYAFIKSGNTKEIYINGTLALGGATSLPLAGDLTTLSIGGGPAGYIDGWVDDFAVFAGQLHSEHLTRLARGESPATVLQPLPRGFEITGSHLNPDGTYHLEWSSIPFYRYTVEYSTTLAAGSWLPLTAYIPSGGASTATDVTLPAGLPRIFLRVVQ